MTLQSKLFVVLTLSTVLAAPVYATSDTHDAVTDTVQQNTSSSNPSISNEEAASRFLGEPLEIVGDVQFEARKTKEAGIGQGPGNASQTYWSVVFLEYGEDGETRSRTLFGKRFYQGEDSPPAFIELNGIPLTPGARVRVKGPVVTQNPGFRVMIDLEQISIL